MQTNALPEIEDSDLKAARDFLISFREEERRARAGSAPLGTKGAVTLRNGIARARVRAASKNSA